MPDSPNLPIPIRSRPVATLDQLAAIPEEEIWLAKQKSRQTRRAYRLDVRHFVQALGITTTEALRQVDHLGADAAGARRRGPLDRALAAGGLSSLFKHLVKHGAANRNPVVDVERPAINRDEGSAAAFAKSEARKLLDAPPADTLAGLRDRAILSVGLQAGFRRAEIAALNVGDLHQNRCFDVPRVTRKGGRREALAINPQAAQRVRAYLELAGHGDQPDAPLFRPLRGNGKPLDLKGRVDPDAIDRLVRKYTARSGLDAATQRTRCAQPSSRPPSKMARNSKTCGNQPGTATRQRPSSTTDAATILRKTPVSLRPIER